MNFFSEKICHFLFKIGVVIKIIVSFGEIILGLMFYFLSYEVINKIVFFFVGEEFMENPRGFVWNYIFRELQNFFATPKSVWAFIFLSHGIIKMFVANGLLRNKLWAYPASAVIFALFIIYQLYQIHYNPSMFLELITIFDAALIALIMHEYRYKKNCSLKKGEGKS